MIASSLPAPECALYI